MFATQNTIDEIKNCAEWADRLVRADLIHGYIAGENDYTSNFTSAFRREINSRSINGVYAHSQVLRPTSERKYGADGCIIFRNPTHFKVGVFEAKWPRLSSSLMNSKTIKHWDSIQKSSKISHFDSQIQRQSAWANFAIWEMFYFEEPYGAMPSLFPKLGSSCVWHIDAFKAYQQRTNAKVWSNYELCNLLPKHVSISDVVQLMLQCKQGVPIIIDKSLLSDKNSQQIQL
jgi:hypothetical protein